MDLMGFLRALFDHNQQVIGGLIVVILAVSALLLLRIVSQEKSAESGTKTRGSDVDLGAIESAFKRVLAAQGSLSPTAGTSGAAPSSVEGDAPERDVKMQELAREIDRLKIELSAKSSVATGFGGTVSSGGSSEKNAGSSSNSVEVAALNAKISELQDKLVEYEIIEDDIADLSRFKEENAELKSELELLKASADTTGGATAFTELAVTKEPAAANVATSTTQESASVAKTLATVNESPVPSLEVSMNSSPEAVEPYADLKAEIESESLAKPVPQLQTNSVAPADPEAPADPAAATAPGEAASLDLSALDLPIDTEKMINEVSHLALHDETTEPALDGAVDTEKLLAEVDSLVPSSSIAPQMPPDAPPQAPLKAPPESPIDLSGTDSAVHEDDLLAEFKESNDGSHG